MQWSEINFSLWAQTHWGFRAADSKWNLHDNHNTACFIVPTKILPKWTQRTIWWLVWHKFYVRFFSWHNLPFVKSDLSCFINSQNSDSVRGRKSLTVEHERTGQRHKTGSGACGVYRWMCGGLCHDVVCYPHTHTRAKAVMLTFNTHRHHQPVL